MCGSLNPTPAGCYCDSDCVSWGDCCSDYFSVCGGSSGTSCVGYCRSFPASMACYCDSECTFYGDCCPDYFSVCP